MELRLPDIGDFSDVPIIEVHVAPGDTVAVDDPLITLESDKATMDVPSPGAGTISELRVGVGDTVSEGTVLGVLFGALIMACLLNGMTLQAVSPEFKFIARGAVLSLAVWMDVRLAR